MVNLGSSLPNSFTTERLLARRYSVSDADDLLNAASISSARVFPFLPWCHPAYDRGDADQWINLANEHWSSGSGYHFALRELASGDYVGACGVNGIDDHPVLNLGYWLKTGATGHGYATEATLGLCRYAFRHLKAQRIEIIMSVNNDPSRQVAIRSGAIIEGTLVNRLHLHGENHNAYLYAMTPDKLHQ